MSSERTPVSGGDENKGEDDGVSQEKAGGRNAGGQSGGGSYDRNQGGSRGDDNFGGFMGHGGQSKIDYHGAGAAGDQGDDTPNAATESDDSEAREGGAEPGPSAPQFDREAEQTRSETLAGGNTVTVMEESGVAAAEAAGTVAAEGQHRTDDNPPGSG